jgi:hypothetical protein
MRGRGGLIVGTLPTWTTTATSGVFTLREAQAMRTTAQWPRGPVAPTSLTATAGNAQLTLSWTAPTTTHGTITNHLVEYTPSGGSAAYVLTGSTATSYTLTGLTNGTEYSVRVAAVNFTTGDYSGTATGTPVDASVPGAPTALSLVDGGCTSGSNGRVSVTFTPPASDGGSAITHYRLRNTSSAVPFWEFTSAGGTSNRIINVGSGWPAFYGNSIVRLSAVNDVGEGSFLQINIFPTLDVGQVCE